MGEETIGPPEDGTVAGADPASDPASWPDRRKLITDHVPLVKTIALKIAQRLPPHIDVNDLISAGTIGLIDAVDKFDRTRATNLKKYAEIRIKGAILDELRAMDHITRTVRRQSAELDRIAREVEQETGKAATEEQVAGRLGMDLESFHALVGKLKPVYLVSLEDLGSRGGEEVRDPYQFLEDPEAVNPSLVLHFKKLRELVAQQIEGLKDKQRLVVSLYYHDDLTLKEIGKVLGVTESRVSQLLSAAIEVLQKRVRRELSKERASAHPLE